MLPSETQSLARLFLDAFGSFWTEVYTGARDVYTLARSAAKGYERTHTLVSRITPFLAAQNVEPYDRRDWYGLTFRAVDKDQSIDFGEPDREFGDGASFGQTTLAYAQYPLDVRVYGIGQLLNRMSNPTVWWFEGQDYSVNTQTHQIRFAIDPLLDSRFDNPFSQAEVRIWAYAANFNADYDYQYVGYMSDYKENRNTPQYLAFAKTLVPLLVDGPTAGRFDDALSAATGYPLALTDETVIDVSRDASGLLVITDQHAYRLPPFTDVSVSVGDELSEGDTLCAALQLHEFNRGALPESCDFLTLGPEIFGGRFAPGLIFRNASLPTTTTVDTKVRLRFQIDGLDHLVEKFWSDVRAAEDRIGRTLLEYLLDRDNPPEGAAPATMNPAEFVAAHLLRWGGVRIFVQAGKNGSSQAKRLSKVVGLGSAAARFVVTLAGSDLSDQTPKLSEATIEGGFAATVLEETTPAPSDRIPRPTATELC